MKIILIIAALIPSLAFSTSNALGDFSNKSCSERNGVQIKIIAYALQNYDNIMSDHSKRKITKDQVTRSWDSLIDDISQANDKIMSNLEVQMSSSSESTKSFVRVSQTAKSGAIFTTVNLLASKKYNDKIIRDTFIKECQAGANEIITELKRSEDAINKRRLNEIRDRTNARRAEADRELERMERESARADRQAERERSERLIIQGLGILNQNNSRAPQPTGCFLQRDTVSGFHKTCYYSCNTGVVTSTVGSTEICSLTR